MDLDLMANGTRLYVGLGLHFLVSSFPRRCEAFRFPPAVRKQGV
jgi:hypothetical protein